MKIFEDPCPNCGSTESYRRVYERREIEGQKVTLIFCERCPVAKQPELNFPNILKSGSLDKYKYAKYELKPEEIKATQALRPATEIKDAPEIRRRDAIELKRVFVGAQFSKGADGASKRSQKIKDSLEKEFGNKNFEIVADDGFEVAARAVA